MKDFFKEQEKKSYTYKTYNDPDFPNFDEKTFKSRTKKKVQTRIS